jgi:hypothetical protein
LKRRTYLTQDLQTLFEYDPLAFDPKDFRGHAADYLSLLQYATKKEIKENTTRVKQSDYSGDTLAYLHRVRGGKKAAKTKIARASYRKPKKVKEGRRTQISDIIGKIAASKKMSEKSFRKKYADAVAKYEQTGKLFYNRELQLLRKDIQFLDKGKKVFINERKYSKVRADLYLARLHRKMYGDGSVIYPEISIEVYFDGRDNLHIPVPSFGELEEFHSPGHGEAHIEMLQFIADNWGVHFWWK